MPPLCALPVPQHKYATVLGRVQVSPPHALWLHTLFSHRYCPYVQRFWIAAQAKGLPLTWSEIDLANKPPWILELSPMGKVPSLVFKQVCCGSLPCRQ